MASLAALFFAIYTAPVVQGQSNCERSDLDEFESMVREKPLQQAAIFVLRSSRTYGFA